MTAVPIRVMLYSHDAQGLGHLRRNLALAHHLSQSLPGIADAPVTGLLMAGLTPGEGFEVPAGFDWLILPGVMKSPDGYRPRRLRSTRAQFRRLRSQVLEAAMTSFAPDLLIIDRHPYGVRQELLEPLRALKRLHPHTRVVLGLREVLDDPTTMAREWASLGPGEQQRSLIDQVWVYGDPTVHNLARTGEGPQVLADRMRFTGYLALGRRAVDGTGDDSPLKPEPFVLTTAGGGSDAMPMLMQAAAMEPPAGHQHVVVCGPQLSEPDVAEVTRLGGPRTRVMRTWPGMSRHINDAAAVISMGGYNTVCEILSTSTPSLVIPRETPRLEQLIRARALERRGAVEVLRSSEADPTALGQWAASAVHRSVNRNHIDLAGLAAVPQLAHELLTADAGQGCAA
ncbi:glycosyltransferase family protein [Actinomyces radicidentis]|uniref:Glycosyl transferase family 28 n=1 Tax=Actinomyces radicidentis TaxID=111015 RepID=A0A0X8JGI8_ACTRD|nr:glycosyltransferase [Actinomyces radicidentis]AMD88217.1 glycosyl transferase family 28 [Actinomyces radicidentis]